MNNTEIVLNYYIEQCNKKLKELQVYYLYL